MSQKNCLVLYSLTMFLFGQQITVGPLIPYMAQNLNLKELEMGFIFSYRGIGMLIGCIGCKYIEKYIESHRLLAISSFISGLMVLIINLTQNWLIIGLTFLIQGFSLSVFEVYINILAIQLDELITSQSLSIVQASFALGAILQPIVISYVQQYSFYMIAIEAFILALAYMYTMVNQRENQINQQDDQNNAEYHEISSDVRYLLNVYFFIYVGIEIGFGSWLPTYCYKNNYLDLKESAQSPSIFWLTIFIGRSAGVYLGKYSALKMMLYQTVLCLITLILSALLIEVNFIRTGIYSACIFYGLGMSSLYPLGFSAVSEMKMALSIKLSSEFVISTALGDVLMPYIIGLIMNSFGLQLFFPICIFIAVLLLIISLYLSQINNKLKRDNKNLKLIELTEY